MPAPHISDQTVSPAGHSDHRRFRDVMGCFTTGVAVLTAGQGEQLHASTVNSLTSVSLRPALILVCLRRDGRSARRVRRTGCFGLTILGEQQSPLARFLADGQRPAGAAQLAGVSLRAGSVTGVPLLADGIAWIECTTGRVVVGGDHDVVFGRVRSLAADREAVPLVFFQGSYGRFDATAQY